MIFIILVWTWDCLGWWGDFNVNLSDAKKISGLYVYPQEYKDFVFCVNSCDLLDINFKVNSLSGKANREYIFKRLDRLMVNQVFLGMSGLVKIDYLDRTGCYHASLLLSCENQSTSIEDLSDS